MLSDDAKRGAASKLDDVLSKLGQGPNAVLLRAYVGELRAAAVMAAPPKVRAGRREWLEQRLDQLDRLLVSVADPAIAEKLLRESRVTRGEFDKIAQVEDTEDDDDEVDPRTASEEDIVSARLAKLRRGLSRAEKTGNVAAIAALSRQIAIAEDRIVQLRPPASRGLEDATEEQFLHELRGAASEMPEPHLRAFVDVYLERHRLLVVPDPAQIRRIKDDRDEEDA